MLRDPIERMHSHYRYNTGKLADMMLGYMARREQRYEDHQSHRAKARHENHVPFADMADLYVQAFSDFESQYNGSRTGMHDAMLLFTHRALQPVAMSMYDLEVSYSVSK